MKKSTRIISLFLFLFLLAPCMDAVAVKTRTIIRHIIISQDKPQPQAAEPVTGESDKEEGYTEICFNEDIGQVIVTVINSEGLVVDQIAVDTEVQRGVVLTLPDSDEAYELVIEGGQYLGYGTIY